MPEDLPVRRPRADAQRNRERLLLVAREAFSQRGAAVTMDDVAKRANVGAGTLYRHFPTREALLEAVYCAELERLADAEADLAARLDPLAALEAWMLLFIDYIEAKKLIWPVVTAVIADQSRLIHCSSSTMTGAITRMVQRGVDSGQLRPDLNGMDLLWALYGASNALAPDGQQMARRLVTILLHGARRTVG